MRILSRRAAVLGLTAAAGAVLIPVPRARAQVAVACVNCDEKITQLLQYAEQIFSVIYQLKQYALQVQQYENMVTNTLSLPQQLWSDITGDIRQIQHLADIGNLIAGNAGSVTAELAAFNSAAQEIMGLPNMIEKYNAWAQMSGQNITKYQQALQAATDQINNDDQLTTQIQAASADAEGQKQAIQATNEFLGVQIKATQNLHETLMSSTQALIAYNDAQANRQGVNDQALVNFLSEDAPPMTGGERY